MTNQWPSTFHPVLLLPEGYEVLDFSRPEQSPRPRGLYTVGRYNEHRPALYSQALFDGDRSYHIGIDLGGPAGTPVYAFEAGTLSAIADHRRPGDYGPTLITEHELGGRLVYVLLGHLSRESLRNKKPGQSVQRGEVLGYLGTETENGGWPPHVHVQLSYRPAIGADMPGVVSAAELAEALAVYPDPRLILGPIY